MSASIRPLISPAGADVASREGSNREITPCTLYDVGLPSAEPGAAVQRQPAAIQRRGEVGGHQIAVALGSRLEAEEAASRHRRRESRDVRQVERPGGEADVEPVDQPSVAEAPRHDQPAREFARFAVKAKRIQPDLVRRHAPARGEAEPPAAPRRLDPELERIDLDQCRVADGQIAGQELLNPCVRHRVGRELGGRRRRRARSTGRSRTRRPRSYRPTCGARRGGPSSRPAAARRCGRHRSPARRSGSPAAGAAAGDSAR